MAGNWPDDFDLKYMFTPVNKDGNENKYIWASFTGNSIEANGFKGFDEPVEDALIPVIKRSAHEAVEKYKQGGTHGCLHVLFPINEKSSGSK